jgi:2-(1,2-epoxy-1,2-dihydrophenyl)acetyl-CoA isomerase
MQSIPRGEGADLEGFIDKTYHDMIRALVKVPVPTIAAVRGGSVGFGFSLALACDFRIVAEDAKMGAVFTRIAIIPDGGTSYFLGRLVGAARALELIYTARTFSGQEAVEMGLAYGVAPDDEVEAQARELAERLAKGPPGAFKEIRTLVYGNLDRNLDEALREEARIQAERLRSADAAEGVMAFLQHRTPNFTGR